MLAVVLVHDTVVLFAAAFLGIAATKQLQDMLPHVLYLLSCGIISVVCRSSNSNTLAKLDGSMCKLQVGLAGPSGSGKTVFSEKVQHFLPGLPP